MKSPNMKLSQLQGERFDNLAFAALMARTHKLGKTYYVDSNTGNNSYGGTRIGSPLATIAAAMALCTANQGDKIIVLPQHAETVTSTVTVKAGTKIIGLEDANRRPVITINGATDLFNMSGAGSLIYGLDLTIATTDAATALINVAAAKCTIQNVKMIPSATSVNVEDCITLASGADDVVIRECEIFNTVVAVNSFISIEAAVARMKLLDCFFFGDVATAGIIDGAAATQICWLRNTVGVVGTTKPVVTLDSNPTGVVDDFTVLGTHTTIATNANWGNALRLSRIRVSETTDASAQASTVIPAADVE